LGFHPVAAVGTIVHSYVQLYTAMYNCTQLCTWGETVQKHGTHKIAGKTRKTKQKIEKHKTVN